MRKILVVLMVIGLFLVYGCFNVFSPLFSDPSGQDLSNISDINFLNDMGDYYADLGDYTTAKKFYERALEINPKSSRALAGIANCELFQIVPRTNILGFYETISSNASNLSNYSDFIDYYVTNSLYFNISRIISSNLYIIITGNSDNKSLTDDINVHFNFSVFNKIHSFFLSLDSDNSGNISTNDLAYRFIKEMTNSSDSNFVLPNDLILAGDKIDYSMRILLSEGQKSIKSLSFITNKLNSKENSIEVQILKAFSDIDTQLTNVYTNFYRYYSFYNSMYNKIIELLTNNGISLDIATNIDRLTNALSISNYATFDYQEITNILNTNQSDAWNILTNYLDLNRLTN